MCERVCVCLRVCVCVCVCVRVVCVLVSGWVGEGMVGGVASAGKRWLYA